MRPTDVRDTIEQTAARLRALGCTEEQVALHVKRLTAIAKKRGPPPERKRSDLPSELDDAQLALVLASFRHGTFARYRVDGWRWAGEPILDALNAPAKGEAIRVASRILASLERRQLIGRGPQVGRGVTSQFLVLVLQPPPMARTRLRPAQVQLARTRLRPRPHGEAGASMAMA